MANRIFTLLLVLMALSASSLASAADAYIGTAPVASQSDQDRAAALRVALGQVVTKAAKGDAAVLKRPEVARALTRAERYMRSYSYQPNTAANADPTKAPGKFLLVAQFDVAQVDALVRDQAAAPASADAGAIAAPNAANPAAPVASAAGAAASIASGPDAAAVASDAAPAPASPGSYRLWFSGLRSAEDYARLVAALNASPEVRALRIEQAHGNVLQTRIDARGSLQELTESLAASRLAQATNTKPPVEGVDAMLDFEP